MTTEPEVDPDPVINLIYASAAVHEISRETLTSILEVARTHNASRGITGMLLYVEGSFLQVLEGRRSEVHELYAHISEDKRHRNAIKLIEEVIAERRFENWSMGFANVTREDLKNLPGCNDFFRHGSCFLNMSANNSRKLLMAFRQGKWRRHVA